MSEEDDRPVAEQINVKLGQNTDTIPIDVDGEALLIDGYYQAKVCIQIGSENSTISVTLSPAETRALRDELDDAVDEARDEVEKWLDRDDFRRY